MNAYEMGQWGEEYAAQYLCSKGYEILSRNFRIKSGELDIVALRKKQLLFIEVKTRKSATFSLPCESVTIKKQRTIKKVAAAYLNSHTLFYDEIRFDVIEVYANEKKIRHLKNAF